MNLADELSQPVSDLAAVDVALIDRARRLAHVPPSGSHEQSMEVLVCRLGTEEFALELRLLKGVFPATSLTSVPCTPAFVAGLLNLRGEIVTVLDLASVLGLTARERREVLLSETSHERVGLLVDEALDVRWVALGTLERGLAGSEFVRGIDNARTVLVDLEGLLSDERFNPLP